MHLAHQETFMTALSVNPLLKDSLDSALISLCDRVEVLAPGSIAGLTICNPPRTRLERAIFPRLPQYAAEIVEIPLSPDSSRDRFTSVTANPMAHSCLPIESHAKRRTGMWH